MLISYKCISSTLFARADAVLPQVLGLSASLGAETKSTNLVEATGKATDRLNKMCQHLDAPTVIFPENEDVRNLEEAIPELGEDETLVVEGWDSAPYPIPINVLSDTDKWGETILNCSRPYCEFREKLISIAEALANASESLFLENLRSNCLNHEKVIMDLVEAEKEAALTNNSELQIAALYIKLVVR